MRILLMGEYSRLHNSLKEGLVQLGHQVTLVGSGDGFKNYPADHSYEPLFFKGRLGSVGRKIFAKLTGFDLVKIEHGIRFKRLLPELRDFDIVQLINERPIQTTSQKELRLLQTLFRQNKKIFLLSCGVDFLSVKYLFSSDHPKNIVAPLRQNPNLRKDFAHVLEYTAKAHRKIHDFVYENCLGIIASDIDYVLPLQNDRKFLGLIPNPVNLSKLDYQPLTMDGRIVIFLGINQWTYHQKGVSFFEDALRIIADKYGEKVETIITRNVPYSEYINSYNRCHILLDQTYAFDQGYNALEAMAKGKVVFTGAEQEFCTHYSLAERVAVNAVPDVDRLVHELSALIENPNEIEAISKRARNFIVEHHDHVQVAEKYLQLWQQK